MNKQEFIQRGQELKALGFNIIPLYGWNDTTVDESQAGKRPIITWEKYKTEQATDKDIVEWSSLKEELNIGIVCGETSNLTVIDADSEEAIRILEELGIPETLMVKTRKGYHYYFKYCLNPVVNNAVRALDGVDIRTQGGQVVAPYSKHKSGHIYEWVNLGTPIADFPKTIEQLFIDKAKASKKSVPQDYDITKELVDGKRNKTLASIGGVLRHSGVPAHLVEMFLKELNANSPDPKSDDEIETISKSVCRYENTPPAEKWTDYGLSSTFLRSHGDSLRFAFESGKWYFYNGSQWKGTYTQKSSFLNKDIMDMFVGFLINYANSIPDDDENKEKFTKFLKDYESTAKMVQFFRGTAARVTSSENDFDADPYLFNCRNCSIDLRTVTPIPHDKNQMLSKISPVEYDPNAKCPTWEKFLDRVFAGDQDLIKYIQTALGYTMVGRIKEKAVFLLVGEGDNGKSKFLDAVGNIFDVDNDQYGTYSNFSTFTTARDGEIRCDLASLRGARYVFASEGKADAALDDTVIKSITGDDRIRARFLHQNEVVFRPTFKIWLATNKLPYIKSTEHAMRVRIKLINFNVIIPKEEQDQNLGDKLKAEASGILNWVLEGVKTYNQEGLKDCAAVMNDTKEYLDSMDLYKQFFDEKLEYKEGSIIEARALFNCYTAWMKDKGQNPVSETRFGVEFAKHMKKTHGVDVDKVQARRNNGSRYYKYNNISFTAEF